MASQCSSLYFQVKLVVIDNLTYHLRCDFGPDIGPRSHILHHLSQAFRRLAQQYSLAVN